MEYKQLISDVDFERKNFLSLPTSDSQNTQEWESFKKHYDNDISNLLKRYNDCMNKNKTIRDEIDKIRKEKQIFEHLCKNYTKEIMNVEIQISQSTSSASVNFESEQ